MVKRLDYRSAKEKNVCKDLRGRLMIYCIFVDSKHTTPWTEYDIRSTLDSVAIAVTWLKSKAVENNVELMVKTDYWVGEEFTTVNKKLPDLSIQETLNSTGAKKGFEKFNKWSNSIAKKAGISLYMEKKDGIREIKKPQNKERLVAYLRDTYMVESVVLIYMLNNYYKADVSLPVNTYSNTDIEYAIISYKYPSEIAKNILNLYGAADMYESTYRTNKKKIEKLSAMFPNEIMLNPYAKEINTLMISDYTKYLIGWQKDYNPAYESLYKDKIIFY